MFGSRPDSPGRNAPAGRDNVRATQEPDPKAQAGREPGAA